MSEANTIKRRKVRFGYVNVDEPNTHQILYQYTGNVTVQYFPTILIYGFEDKTDPYEYMGNYNYNDINFEVSVVYETREMAEEEDVVKKEKED